MSADVNVKIISQLYDAFTRGDVATILDGLTDDVDWASDTSSTVAPWYGVRHGKAETAAFFQEFGSAMEVKEFTPMVLAGTDDTVLAVVKCVATSRITGKNMDMNLHHYFAFDGDKVCYYRGSEDTQQTEAALRA